MAAPRYTAAAGDSVAGTIAVSTFQRNQRSGYAHAGPNQESHLDLLRAALYFPDRVAGAHVAGVLLLQRLPGARLQRHPRRLRGVRELGRADLRARAPGGEASRSWR